METYEMIAAFSGNAVEAEMVRVYLESYKIPAHVQNLYLETLSSAWIVPGSDYNTQVLVPTNELDKAFVLLDQLIAAQDNIH